MKAEKKEERMKMQKEVLVVVKEERMNKKAWEPAVVKR